MMIAPWIVFTKTVATGVLVSYCELRLPASSQSERISNAATRPLKSPMFWAFSIFLATVENGSEDERALLAAAYLVFLRLACSIALDGYAAIVRPFLAQRTTISVVPSN